MLNLVFGAGGTRHAAPAPVTNLRIELRASRQLKIVTKWFGESISNFSYQLVKCVSAAAHQPLTKPNQLATKLYFIFRFISPIYLTSPSYLSIEVNKIAF